MLGQPADRYEHEAEQVADVILGQHASRTTPEGGEGEASVIAPDLEARILQLRGTGAPLPDAQRTFFEQRLGVDLGHVRLHTDPSAADTAQALDAYAYTLGSSIVFAPHQYTPGTPAGDRLLAHELVHVVQQTAPTPGQQLRRCPVQERTPNTLLQGSWRFASEVTREMRGASRKSGNGAASSGFLADGVEAMADTWQSKPRWQWCVDGGTAQVSAWRTSKFTFQHDGADSNFLELSVSGMLNGAAKAQDLHYAKAGAVVVGLVKVRTPANPAPAAHPLFLLREGGKSAAHLSTVADIDATIPIDGASVNVRVPLKIASEGELAPFDEALTPPASHDTVGTPGAETFVDVYLAARVEAAADVESTCGLLEGSFDDENWARATARYMLLNWSDRRSPAAIAREPEEPIGPLGKGRWSCKASCNVEGKEPQCTGRVTGSSSGHSNQNEACREAKRDATQKAPRHCYARHCQCSDCTNR